MKKRWNRIIAFSICMVMLSGCSGKNPEDILLESEAVENTEQETRGLAQFVGETEWKEEFDITKGDGSEVNVHIDADITLPDADSISMIEVREPEFNAEYKEKIVREIFGNNQIYYNDAVHLPRALMEERIAEDQEELLNIEEYITSLNERWQNALNESWEAGLTSDIRNEERRKKELEEEIQLCQNVLPNASNSYQPAQDFEGNSYRGEIDGIMYIVTFAEGWKGDYRTKSISLLWENAKDVCPKELQSYDIIATDIQNEYASGEEEHAQNQCRMTLDEASKLAEQYLQKFGMPLLMKTESWDFWWNKNLIEEETGVTDGYVLVYRPESDGVAFSEFANEDDDVSLYYLENGRETYSCNSSVSLIIKDEGVISMQITNPIEVVSVTESVSLLSFEQIKDCFCQELSADFDRFELDLSGLGMSAFFNQLKLGYLRIADPENEFGYSYVPVWQLSSVDGNKERVYSIYVNAIDGKALLWKEVM